jgi:hypothetical protein
MPHAHHLLPQSSTQYLVYAHILSDMEYILRRRLYLHIGQRGMIIQCFPHVYEVGATGL